MTTFFPLASIQDLGQRMSDVATAETVEWAGFEHGAPELRALHNALDPLLIALTYAGYDPRWVLLAGNDVPDQVLRINLAPRSATLLSGGGSSALMAQTGLSLPPGGDVTLVVVPLTPRAGIATTVGLSDALGPFFQTTVSGSYLTISFPASAPLDLAGMLVDDLIPIAELIANAVEQRWQAAGTDNTGLLSVIDPEDWSIGAGEAETFAFKRLAVPIVAGIFDDPSTVRRFLIEETTPRMIGSAGPPSVRDRLIAVGGDDESFSSSGELRRGWTAQARDEYADEPNPFRARDHRKFTFTELVLDAINHGCFASTVLGLGTGPDVDPLAEGLRVLAIPPEERTAADWEALAIYVPLQAPLDQPGGDLSGAPGARAAIQLVESFSTFEHALALTVVGELTSAICTARPSRTPASLTDDLDLVADTASPTDFEAYCLRVQDCLALTLEREQHEDYLAAAVERCVAFLEAGWDPAWGARAKLAWGLIALSETCRKCDPLVTAIGQVAAIWDDSITDDGDAPAAWMTWALFEQTCTIANGCQDLPGWSGAEVPALNAVHERVVARTRPRLHLLSDEELATLQQAYITKLMAAAHTTAVGTTMSKYYHLLVAQRQYSDPAYDFAWRQRIDQRALQEALLQMDGEEEVQQLRRDARVAACQEVLETGNLDTLATEQSQWILSRSWVLLILLRPDAPTRLQRELDRLAAVDEALAKRALDGVLSQASMLNAFTMAAELFTVEQLAAAYEALLTEMGMNLIEAGVRAQLIATNVNRLATSVGWLARAPNETRTSSLEWLLDYEAGTHVGRSRVLASLSLLTTMAGGVLLAGDFLYNWATVQENAQGLLLDTIAGIGLSAQVMAEGLDLLAAFAGWYWEIPPFPRLAPLTLVAPEAIGCCALPWWYATKLIPARATWMVQEFLPYTISVARWTGWAVTVRFRAMATVCQYSVGALFETYALGCSLYAANVARQSDEWATVRAELAHACASISIIAGSLIAIYCVYFLWTVPVIATALVIIGVIGHLVAWWFGPESYAEGRLESDLRALGVLPPDIVELSPINGWHLNDGTTDVIEGDPIARYYVAGDVGAPPDHVSLAVRSQILFSGLQGLQPVTAGQETSRWHPRFLHDLWGEPGTLTDQVPNGTVVAAEQIVGTVRAADGGVIRRFHAREAGTVVWLHEPLVLEGMGVNRYGAISVAE